MRPISMLAAMTAVSLCTLLAAAAPALAGADKKSAKIVQKMIDAHGGMDKWTSAPSVAFTEQWSSPAGPGPKSAYVVEQGARRVYMDIPDMGAKLGWDGENAWSVNWAMPMPPRFLAQLNYYFLNLPWLTQDPGVNLAYEGAATLWEDPTEYHAIRMTFDSGVGDTPDDYYVLYIDPKTYVLHANRYIVTYTSLLQDGMKHTPEHILVYDKYIEVDGLRVATHYTIYEADESLYAECAATDWSFKKPFDAAKAVMPAEGVVDDSQP